MIDGNDLEAADKILCLELAIPGLRRGSEFDRYRKVPALPKATLNLVFAGK